MDAESLPPVKVTRPSTARTTGAEWEMRSDVPRAICQALLM